MTLILEGTTPSLVMEGINLGLAIPFTSEMSPEFVIADAKRIERAILKREPEVDTSKIDWRVYDDESA